MYVCVRETDRQIETEKNLWKEQEALKRLLTLETGALKRKRYNFKDTVASTAAIHCLSYAHTLLNLGK